MKAIAAFLLLMLVTFAIAPAIAQTAAPPAQPAAPVIDRSKLLVQPRNDAVPAFTADPAGWVMARQKQFYSAMSGELRQIRQGSPMTATLMLMGLSFAYGVLHAAGPGHGKAVVSAWLLGNNQELHRGVQIAFLSAFVQAMVAIGLISILMMTVGAASAVAQNAAKYLEALSFLAISGMGVWLAWQALRQRFGDDAMPAHAHAHHHSSHGHAHATHPAHHHRHADDGHTHHHVHHHQAHDHAHDHAHEHVHDDDCGCGHAHMPAARELDGDWSWRRAWTLALAVGIRPCTGAILVLLFSSAAGLYWAGVASTLVMGLGTAITVSALAALAVGSRKLALRYASRNSAWLDWTAFGLKFAAGIAIVILGFLLFWGSLSGAPVA
ncbi:MAG: nickel/cobalt transporter [Hyphomicrobiales bacterium]